MSEENVERIHVSGLEKLIINFAIPSDFVHWTIRSKFTDEYSEQTLKERLFGIWNGKIYKYKKLLCIKQANEGKIPEKFRVVCKQTPCGKVRLFLAEKYRR